MVSLAGAILNVVGLVILQHRRRIKLKIHWLIIFGYATEDRLNSSKSETKLEYSSCNHIHIQPGPNY